MSTKRNPFGFSVTDLALLGGVAWVFLSPNGQLLLNTILPAPATPEPIRGIGGVGDTSGAFPANPQFTISNVSAPLVIVPGTNFSVEVTGSYVGPQRQFVVGVELTEAWPGGLCAQIHGAVLQTGIETNLHVPDSGTQYYWRATPSGIVQVGHPIIGGGPPVIQWHVYLRDLNGSLLADRWHCWPLTQVI